MNDDGLCAARGIVHGLLLSVAVWAVVVLLVGWHSALLLIAVAFCVAAFGAAYEAARDADERDAIATPEAWRAGQRKVRRYE